MSKSNKTPKLSSAVSPEQEQNTCTELSHLIKTQFKNHLKGEVGHASEDMDSPTIFHCCSKEKHKAIMLGKYNSVFNAMTMNSPQKLKKNKKSDR